MPSSSISTGGENKPRILVHCIQGLNRSAAVVVAFLMKHLKHLKQPAPAREVIRVVSEKRPGILTNAAFIRRLVRYERELGELGAA